MSDTNFYQAIGNTIQENKDKIEKLEKQNTRLKTQIKKLKEQLKGLQEERDYLFNKYSTENENLRKIINTLRMSEEEWLEETIGHE